MNATTFAKFAIVCAAGFAAVTGAEAKGANVNVGLTIVSSCAVSGAGLHHAALTNATVATGCSHAASYKVSLADEHQAARHVESGHAGAEAGFVVVTLTY